MQVISLLPPQKLFSSIEGTERWPYRWQANSTDRLLVCAEVSDIWLNEWNINISEVKAKTDKVEKTNQLRLECRTLPKDLELQKAQFIIEF